MMKLRIALPLIALAMTAGAASAPAQQTRLLNALPPVDDSAGPSAREAEPFDPTGYWVSIVTEDWRIRMATPQVGDHVGVPLTKEAAAKADTWHPREDIEQGLECKAFGIGRIMREPTRLHITWDGDNRLVIDTDAGKQHRVLRFGQERNAEKGEPSWQGFSEAEWIFAPGGANGVGFGQQSDKKYGTLHVVTGNVLPGYLRKNGVPYSDQTVVTEYIDYITNPDGTEFLIVKTHVWDPVNLTEPYITSSNFRRQKNKDGWKPRDCHIEVPPPGKPAGFG